MAHKPAILLQCSNIKATRLRGRLQDDKLSIIAEVKRKSPSRGNLRIDADAADLAAQYTDGGATCLSVLTDTARFGGCKEDLIQARKASCIPVLRKDFLTSAKDVEDSYRIGSDAILLILHDLSLSLFKELQEQALELGMDVVTEVRDNREFDNAIHSGAYMVAINQRMDPANTNHTVDYSKAKRMSARFDEVNNKGITKIAASGIGVPQGTQIEDLVGIGYDAVLVGEALVTAVSPQQVLTDMRRRINSKSSPANTGRIPSL